MQAILIRIGIDQAYGHWNAPADEHSREFIYVPIPEGSKSLFRRGHARYFSEFLPSLEAFSRRRGLDLFHDLRFPQELVDQATHLDPDFEHLTYGDDGATRGAPIKELSRGDLLVFYAGLRGIGEPKGRLVYAIVGLYAVDRIQDASSISSSEQYRNAHTRKQSIWPSDIVVSAQPRCSGRLRRYIPIGQFSDRAYRVRQDLLDAWGGLSVKGGYIQRSGRLPKFLCADHFWRWFQAQDVKLVASNNE